MIKTVLVKLPEDRNFKISFLSSTESSDLSSFRDSFLRAIEKDFLLGKIVKDKTKSFAFKCYDDTFKCNVEITECNSIDHGSVIEAYILSNVEIVSFLGFSDSLNSSTPTFNLHDNSLNSSTPTVNLHDNSLNSSTPTFNLQDNNLNSSAPTFNLQDNSLNSSTTFNIHDTIDIADHSSSSTDLNVHELLELENSSSACDDLPSLLPPFSSKRSINRVPYPCPVPEFSPTVKKALAEGKILQKYNHFIRECAASLLKMVENPNKTDYENFCHSVADKYKFVNDRYIAGGSPYASFKKMVSSSIRNARYYNKKIQKTKGSYYKVKGSSTAHTPEIIMDEVDNKFHIKEMVEVLKRKNSDPYYVEKSLSSTFEHRRKIVLTSASIEEIQYKYPALKLAECIIFDFNNLTNSRPDFRKESFLKEIERVRKNEVSNDFENSLEVFQFIEKQISPKNVTSCILTLKVGDNPITACGDLQSLHAVVYLDANRKIVSASILSQNHIVTKMNGKEIELFQIIDLLLACYYTFDYEYPKEYANILNFLQYVMLKQAINKKNCSFKLLKYLKLSMIS